MENYGSNSPYPYYPYRPPNSDQYLRKDHVFGNMSNMIEGQLSKKITSDPYVSISVAGAVVGRTYVISNSENPVWQQHFYVPVAHHAAEVHFVVKDSDVVGSQLIGLVTIPVEQIYSGFSMSYGKDSIEGYALHKTKWKWLIGGVVLTKFVKEVIKHDV